MTNRPFSKKSRKAVPNEESVRLGKVRPTEGCLLDKEAEDIARKRTMKLSVVEGSVAGVGGMFGDNYIIPFALSINTSAPLVGILSSTVGLLSPIGQIAGSRWTERRPRKSVLVLASTLQAMMWPLFLLVIALFYGNLLLTLLPAFLIGIYACYMVFGGMTGSTWVSLMGDIVPEETRGTYFGKRSLAINAVGLTMTVVISFLLDFLDRAGHILLGFAIIFLIGMTARLSSAGILSQHYDPLVYRPAGKNKGVNFWKFVRDIPKNNFGIFTAFIALINFSLWIAQPFFAIYMLEELQFDYAVFVITNLASSFVGLFVFTQLGKLADKYGNVRLIRFGAVIIPILPIMWMIFRVPWQIIVFVQIPGGIAWTAFNLATSNFIFDSVPSEQRGIYFAYFNLLIGIGAFAGGLLGSALLRVLPALFSSQFYILFLLSGIGRLLVVIFLLPRIREVRRVSVKKKTYFFRHFNVYRWILGVMGKNGQKKNHSREPGTNGK